jgi:hypothetical protein
LFVIIAMIAACKSSTHIDKCIPYNIEKIYLKMEKLCNDMSIQIPDNWYNISKQTIIHHNGIQLLDCFDNVYQMVTILYPDYDWHVWKFDHLPLEWWNNKQNQRKYLDWFSKELDIGYHNMMMFIDPNELYSRNGRHLYNMYDKNLYNMISQIYNEYDWQPWRFGRVCRGFWNSIKNRRNFVTWMTERLDIHRPDDWYWIDIETCYNKANAISILNYYDLSLYNMLKDIYPHYPWQPWRFKNCPKNYWDSLENRMDFVQWLAQILEIQFPEKWYSIEKKQWEQNGGSTLLRIRGFVAAILMELYPEYPWQPWKFTRWKYK